MNPTPKGNPPLNLPPARLRTRLDGERLQVRDPLRQKYVALTPEEYVRQHFVNYLIEYLSYPPMMMANEIKIELNGTTRRCDTVVFGSDTRVLMIVEYKAPDVLLTQDVFDQIVRYNMTLRARYLVVSNGLNHYCCVIDYKSGSYHFLPKIPVYTDLLDS